MPYDPPTGEELKLTRSVIRANKKLTEARPLDLPWLEGHTSHSLEGVRCNGRERLTTVIDIIDPLEQHAAEMRSYALEVSKYGLAVREAATKLKAEMRARGLMPCPKCRGDYDTWEHARQKKGERIRNTAPYGSAGLYRWEDCIQCYGRGLVEIRVPKTSPDLQS